ncbi:YihY/virulence factor BrkB family protein [Bremerella sp. P1]|uniref:YihY/virulence factor BrkB family protein n=1 Tax=Bremerella sp. P1 TaxID=3026424 RepID=UPI0023680FB1|nr:YihY/virulence factor BrkB family protein [Bremerella sp. P1]WDI41095.1 YihY/virulence factor BrkB family protein [Bremerella sp. P1]
MHTEAPKVLDPSTAMFSKWKKFFSQIVTRWVANDHSTSAAAIAFYVLFSLAPIVVFSVAIAGRILENDADARAAAINFLNSTMGEPYGTDIVEQVKLSAFKQSTLLPTIILTLIVIWSASNTFMQLRKALNRINGFAAENLRGSLIAVVLGRLRATLFSIAVGLLLALASLLSTWSHMLWAETNWFHFISADNQDWITMQFISWFTVLVAFYGMLRFLPMRRPPWREVLSGAVIGTVLFQVAKYGIITIASANVVAKAYATSSVLVITVMWIFMSAHVLLFAAEVGHMLFSPATSPFEKYRAKSAD